MQRVLPSTVVRYLKGNFTRELNDPTLERRDLNINAHNFDALAGLVALLALVPDHLLTLSEGELPAWLAAFHGLRLGLETAVHKERNGPSTTVRGILSNDGRNVILVIHDVLVRCPDELPPPEIAGLAFVSDAKLRTDLRLDIERVRDAFYRGDWKAGTVLAGAAVEALLLWAINEKGSTKWQPVAKRLNVRNPDKGIEYWDLSDYIKVAGGLALITTDTQRQCELTREFRNLIHPGRQQRTQMTCDRATALSAEAGLEHVIRDLKAQFP